MTKKKRKRTAPAGPARRPEAGPSAAGLGALRRLADEALLLLGPVLVIGGFLSPWVVVEVSPLAESLLGLPPGEALPAWRLPGYAREIEESWIVAVVRLFGGDQPDTSRLWWVWASPLSALAAYFGLRARRPVLALVVATVQGFVALFLAAKLTEGLGEAAGESLRPRYGTGLLLSVLGHALIAYRSLAALDRGPRR